MSIHDCIYFSFVRSNGSSRSRETNESYLDNNFMQTEYNTDDKDNTINDNNFGNFLTSSEDLYFPSNEEDDFNILVTREMWFKFLLQPLEK